MKWFSCEVRNGHSWQDEAHFYGKRFKEFIFRIPSIIGQKGKKNVKFAEGLDKREKDNNKPL